MGREGEKKADTATWPGGVGQKLRELESVRAKWLLGVTMQGEPLEGLLRKLPLPEPEKRAFLAGLHKFGFSSVNVYQDPEECA